MTPGAGAAARRPMHRIFALYLVLAGAALGFPHRTEAWPVLVAAHLLALLLLLDVPPAGRLLEPLRRRWPRASRVAADWYPLALIPVLYAELVPLNLAVTAGRYFDPLVLRWEALLFGGQPSRELASALPFLPLSEALHGAYLSYYLIIYGPPLLLYLTGRRDAFRLTVFAVMLTFFVHYLFFIYFPVQGPRYLFPPQGGAIAEGSLYTLAHRILEAGSSRGAAFPSSHVAVAFAQTAMAIRFLPRLAPALALLSTGLAVGAVYGGFHYAADAVVGLLLGVALAALSPALHRRIR